MKKIEKHKAILLRKQDLSYRDILKELPVAKGSLSYWLRDIELNPCQRKKIDGKILNSRDRFLEYNRIRSETIKTEKQFLYNKSSSAVGIINERELKLVGIALYWAEGYTANSWRTVSFANSDPDMICLMMRWFREICKVKEERFRLKLQTHDKKDVNRLKEFWSAITGISLSQFTKSTIKISKSSKLKRGNTLPYGTVQIRVSDIRLFTKIRGWIKGLGAPSSSLA